MTDWLGKPYYSLDAYLKKTFGEKVYKLSLDGGMTCPNRDGTCGDRGCIFCSAGGSGDFAGDRNKSIPEQIREQKSLLQQKRPVHKFIAYFQAYTNTYAPVEYLEKIFREAISDEEVVVLSIGTRPDCLGEEVLSLLEELNRIKPVWVELGLQTMHEATAEYIRRGYLLSTYEAAIHALADIDIPYITHVILGLPGETEDDMLATVRYVCGQQAKPFGIKLQLLHVLRGTDLCGDYEAGSFEVLSQDEYIELVIKCLEVIPEDIVIHRVTGDGPKNILVAPLWSGNKRQVLNTLHQKMKIEKREQGTWAK